MKGKTDLLFGYHSVSEAIKANKRRIFKILISTRRSKKRSEKVAHLAGQWKIPIEFVSPEKLDRLTNHSRHQGLAANVSSFPTKKAADVISYIQKKEAPVFILILDSIEDPHNLGTLIRTGVCAGADYILIPKDRSAGPTAAVSRSSAGAMEHADIFIVTNTASVLRSLKKNDVWISGLDADGDISLFKSDLTGNIALVIGGEHKGIRPGVKKECDFLLSLPNNGKINSLNASVAGGIALYEALRQRR